MRGGDRRARAGRRDHPRSERAGGGGVRVRRTQGGGPGGHGRPTPTARTPEATAAERTSRRHRREIEPAATASQGRLTVGGGGRGGLGTGAGRRCRALRWSSRRRWTARRSGRPAVVADPGARLERRPVGAGRSRRPSPWTSGTRRLPAPRRSLPGGGARLRGRRRWGGWPRAGRTPTTRSRWSAHSRPPGAPRSHRACRVARRGPRPVRRGCGPVARCVRVHSRRVSPGGFGYPGGGRGGRRAVSVIG